MAAWTSAGDVPMTAREFLDAASNGDVDAVDAWLAIEPCGDVNAVRGEGWTALLYAASRSHVHVAQRLVAHPSIDLNATTAIGTSALVMALKRRHNTMIKLLLTHGASRHTISHAHMADALASSWMWADVKRLLSPQWSVRWSPLLHARFPIDQREKCRLVVFANTLALRRTRSPPCPHRQPPYLTTQSSRDRELSASSSLSGFIWGFLDAVGITERLFQDDDDQEDADELLDGGDGRLQNCCKLQWVYLPEPVVHHILEFAMFLW